MLKRLSEFSDITHRFGQLPAAWNLRTLLAAMIVAGLAFTALPTQTVYAATTINVTTVADNTSNDGFCSLREALSYTNGAPANLNCGPDTGSPYTINLPAGTYNISGGELQVGAPGNRTVYINGAGAASTIINQTLTTERVIDLDPVVAGNVDVTITGVTISGGYAQVFGGGAILGGGAGDSLILSDSIITDNHTFGAYSAAGISWSPAGDVTITNTTFSNNVSGQAAGAILFTTNDGSTLSITNSTFTGNTAAAASASAGGALLLGMPGAGTPPTFNIKHNTFVNNQATHPAGAGGAIYIGAGNLTLQYNRIVGNTAGVAGSGGLAVYGGTATATENWWGCNTGPGGACNGALLSAGSLTTSPYLFLRNTADPAAIVTGQSSTLTADFLRDSVDNPVAPSDLAAMVGVPVSWGSTNGTLSGQQATIQSGGTATATLTNNGTCANSTGSATVDSATAMATVTIQCPDLTAVKVNNVGGATILPTSWNWTIHIANSGAGYAAFTDGAIILTDTLPDTGLDYGAPAVSGASGLTGTVNCSIDGSKNLTCAASGPVQLAVGGTFDVVFSATPSLAGPYANPRPAGSCAVDPGGAVTESNEGNNTAGNSVTVYAPPSITSANNTAFTVGSAGSFTVTTTPGYPLATTISQTGALPAGVTFTDNGNGTATLSGTPAAGTGGVYPIVITADNGFPPNAIQNFTLTVSQAPAITSPNNVTFTAGSAGSFTVTTGGYPIPAITQTGALPSGLTFVDNGDGTATLAGTAAAGTGGVYPITITAANGITPDANQNFTLTIDQAPAITSANNTTFTVGNPGSFTVTTTGFPTGASMAINETGVLPTGVTFTDNGDGTATLSGTPAAETGGVYPIVITAGNGILPNATQNFTLTVGSSDLAAVKSNDVGGSTILPAGWTWTIHVANGGAGSAAFADGETILTDNLPDSGLSYGLPAVSGASGLTGTVNCSIDGSKNLTCTASGPVQLAAGGSFDVVFTADPSSTGTYANPRPGGSCAVDPEGAIAETDEGNNTCGDSVVVNPLPPPGAFSKTGPGDGSFTGTSPTITWKTSGNAADYEYCSDAVNNGDCDASWISTGGNTSADLSGLGNNDPYYWQVRAVGIGGTTYADGGAWWSFTARNQTFADVPVDHAFWPQIEAFYSAGISTGCGFDPLIFCPQNAATRAAVAVFLLRAKHGAGYTPPAASHFFSDMPISGKEWMEPWVDQAYREGITGGCGVSPLRFCPENPVTRAAMAVFILRAKYGSAYTPPAASHFFADMPVAGKEWMEPWVDQVYREGITSGCGFSPLIFCPESAVKRQAAAAFIVRAFNLPLP